MASQKSILYTVALTLWVFAHIASSQSDQKTLPLSVLNVMASREERHHHFLWHNIRENWNKLSSSSQKQIRDLGWEPPRPARRYDYKGNSIAITDNDSGEDFLYMHRQMIAKVNKILSDNNESYGRIKGWTSLPAPGDKDWPVPLAYTVPGNSGRTSTIKNWKSNSFYTNTIKSMERTLTSPSELRKMTLGELGSKLEVTVHSWYHLRHSDSSPYGYRPSTSAGLPTIDKKWDDPSYNWLVDTYASHVHPAFWKIHGWVDDRVEDWRKANGLTSIRWKGTWEGGPMSAVSHLWNKKEAAATSLRPKVQKAESNEVKEDVMQEVAQVLFKEGIEVDFAVPVFLESPIKAASKSKRRLCKASSNRKRRM